MFHSRRYDSPQLGEPVTSENRHGIRVRTIFLPSTPSFRSKKQPSQRVDTVEKVAWAGEIADFLTAVDSVVQ
jgi:hypothetical protein